MLRGILGFLPLVLDLAGTFLGLALNCLGLALSLLAQTHDAPLCPAAPALPRTDRVLAELPETRRSGDSIFRAG
jgi:hypothetical protein